MHIFDKMVKKKYISLKSIFFCKFSANRYSQNDNIINRPA